MHFYSVGLFIFIMMAFGILSIDIVRKKEHVGRMSHKRVYARLRRAMA